ncbi:NAD(+) diphosphatase, partial [Pseudomonas fragi]|nr:NAD(+) diphosphatase [Pseudomonas sp. GC01]
MTPRWTTAVLDADLPGGLAVVRGPDGFLLDDNGPLFPREWLK